MKKMVRKIVSSAVALCMVAGMGAVSAFAAPAESYADGSYTAKIAMQHEYKDQLSMCNDLFDSDADIVVKDGTATLSIYVANPAPAFPDQGADGTVKNVKATLGGQQLEFASDMETKPLREFDKTNALFGVTEGQSYTTQVLSLSVPVDQLDAMTAELTTVNAYVNVVMNSDQTFRLQLSDITKAGGSVPAPVQPNETSEKSMQITAAIEAPKPTYSVKVPETVAMGTLSKESDNTAPYAVNVTAENLGSGKVVVSAPAEGVLNSGENTLAFSNSFGTQETSVSAKLSGSFTVAASAVQAAAAGDYVGTANFAISYFAAK